MSTTNQIKNTQTERSERNSTSTMSESMYVVKRNGEQEEVSFDKIIKRIQKYSKDLTKSNAIELAQQIIAQIFNGIPTHKIDELTAEICAAKTTVHPDYGKLASRIIISNHHKNTSPSYSEVIQQLWDNKDVLGEHKPLINERLYKMVMTNKEKINATLDYEYDFTYDYFGFKTLERAYLMRINDKIVERPQHLLMRVALSIHKDDLKEAIKSYKMMAEGYFTHATPTLFNMGTQREQASSCFLLTVDEDSVEGIYKTLTDCAKISKHAGELNELAGIAEAAYQGILGDSMTIAEVGRLLHYSWTIKRKQSKYVSNNEIDSLCRDIMTFGAYGVKLLGAGAGGFLLTVLPEGALVSFREKFSLQRITQFTWDYSGNCLYRIAE